MLTREEALRKAVALGDCVIFAGAGVSVKCGLLDWPTSLNELATHVGAVDSVIEATMKALVARGDLIEAASMLRVSSKLHRKERLAALKDVFDKQGNSAEIRSLVVNPYFAYVTTNYDTLIPRAYLETAGKYLTPFKNIDMDLMAALGHPGPYVMHLHGSIESPDSLVLDSVDYYKLEESKHYNAYLRQLLQDHSVLFVGYSFRDPDIQLLLNYLGEHLAHNWGKDAFALLLNTQGELDRELVSHNVSTLQFADYAQLWDFLTSIAKPSAVIVKPGSGVPYSVARHLETLQRSLAASMAHMRLVSGGSSMPDCVYAGIVATAIGDAGAVGQQVPVKQVQDNIRSVLFIDQRRAEEIYTKAVPLLYTMDAVSESEGTIALKRPMETTQMDAVRQKLANIVAARANVRRGQKVEALPEIGDFVIRLYASESMGLAHSVVGVRSPRSHDMVTKEATSSGTVVLKSFTEAEREIIQSTVLGMLSSPTIDEEELLSKLARCVFTTEIVLHEPTLSSLTGFSSVRHVYLDSNVLLPLLLQNHPFHRLNSSTLRAALEKGIEVRAYSDFLIEVVRHRALALQAAQSEALKSPSDFRAYARMWGTPWINAFIGAYAESDWLKRDASFHDFMAAEAPYITAVQLAGRLDKMGIQVMHKLADISLDDEHRLTGGLQSAYSALKATKPEILVGDEARQMAVLLSGIREGRPCWFVTADKKLVRAVEVAFQRDKIWGSVLSLLVSPVEYANYLELSGARVKDWTGYSRFLWAMLSSNVLSRLMDQLTDTVIESYPKVNLNDLPGHIAKARLDLAKKVSRDMDEGPSPDEKGRLRIFSLFNEYTQSFYEELQQKKERNKNP